MKHSENAHSEIMRRLHQTETNEGVQILLAVESGSRVWGFSSAASDYDVRFIYKRPKEWYLKIDLEDQKDYIEYEITDTIDMYGWDIRKALRLYWNSSPMLVDWLLSPQCYIETGLFAENARKLLPQIFSLESCIHNFRSIAKNDFHKFLSGEVIAPKKYFYVFRSLLSIRWIEKYQTVAPLEFEKLMSLLIDKQEVLVELQKLILNKNQNGDLGFSKPNSCLHSFIQNELEKLQKIKFTKLKSGEDAISLLNSLFRNTVLVNE